jgi:DNA (cytosine-5)-methyltransferase 1
MSAPMTFVDLFCGAGGMTAGLREAGLHHAVGVEYNPVFAKTYGLNNEGHVIVADVAKVTADDIRPFLHGRQLDVLAASPPCQSFSMASTKPRDNEDPRDLLFRHVVRLAKALNPRYLLLENVPGMLTKKTPEGTLIVDDLLRAVRGAGYNATVQRVDASSYGVPQSRRRVIVLAARRPEAPPTLLPPTTSPTDSSVAARVALEPAGRVDEHFYLTPTQTRRAKKRMAISPFLQVIDPSKPSHTMLAAYRPGNENLLVREGERLRRLTPRETARIQTFPSTYKWSGTATQQYTQAGNAVPVKLARHLGESLKRAAAENRRESPVLTRRRRRLHGQ